MPKGIPNNPKTDKRFKTTHEEVHQTALEPHHDHQWNYISATTQYTRSAEDGSSIPLEIPKARMKFACHCGAMKEVEGFDEGIDKA